MAAAVHEGVIDEDEHAADRKLVAGLAQATEFQGQARAQRAINAGRLAACEELFQSEVAGGNEHNARLTTWLLEFPARFSKQNSVLVGSVST